MPWEQQPPQYPSDLPSGPPAPPISVEPPPWPGPLLKDQIRVRLAAIEVEIASIKTLLEANP